MQCSESRHQEDQQDNHTWQVRPLTCQPRCKLLALLAAKHTCLASVFLRWCLQPRSPCPPGFAVLPHSAYCASLKASRLHLQSLRDTLLFADRLHCVACKCHALSTAYVFQILSAQCGLVQSTLSCQQYLPRYISILIHSHCEDLRVGSEKAPLKAVPVCHCSTSATYSFHNLGPWVCSTYHPSQP